MQDELVQERTRLAVGFVVGFGLFDFSVKVTSSLLINLIGVVVLIKID